MALVKHEMSFDKEHTHVRGRPQKTWNKMVRNDLRKLHLTDKMTTDWDVWRYEVIEKNLPTSLKPNSWSAEQRTSHTPYPNRPNYISTSSPHIPPTLQCYCILSSLSAYPTTSVFCLRVSNSIMWVAGCCEVGESLGNRYRVGGGGVTEYQWESEAGVWGRD